MRSEREERGEEGGREEVRVRVRNEPRAKDTTHPTDHALGCHLSGGSGRQWHGYGMVKGCGRRAGRKLEGNQQMRAGSPSQREKEGG